MSRLFFVASLNLSSSILIRCQVLLLVVLFAMVVSGCADGGNETAGDGAGNRAGAPAATKRGEQVESSSRTDSKSVRTIKIDMDALQSSDERFNIVIRNGDRIHFPSIPDGFVFVRGDSLEAEGAHPFLGKPKLSGLLKFIAEQQPNGLTADPGLVYVVELKRSISESEQVSLRVAMDEVLSDPQMDLPLWPYDSITLTLAPEGQAAVGESLPVWAVDAWVEPRFRPEMLSPIEAQDHEAVLDSRRVGVGDTVIVDIPENENGPVHAVIDGRGFLTLGDDWLRVRCEGLTLSELEQRLRGVLADNNVVDADAAQIRFSDDSPNRFGYFSIEYGVGGLAPRGREYAITSREYRLREALQAAKLYTLDEPVLYVIRADEASEDQDDQE